MSDTADNNKRGSLFILIGAMAGLISGCETTTSVTGAPERLYSVKEELDFAKSNYGQEKMKLYFQAADDQNRRTSLRNSIVLGRMHAIDLAYGQYERALFIERQRIPFWASTASMSLTAIAGSIGDLTAQTALIAVDNGIKGTRGFYERDILLNKSIEIVQTNMRAERNRVRAAIISNLSETDSNYPLELALSDVERYRAAGTFSSGVQSASNSASSNLTVSQSARNQAKTINSTYGSDDITALLIKFAQSSDGMTKMLEAMRAEGVEVDAGVLLYDKNYATQRLAVYNRLKS